MKVFKFSYNTGIPGDLQPMPIHILYQNRLNDYRRVDVGFKVLLDNTIRKTKKKLVG
jgi:hypothetical protein